VSSDCDFTPPVDFSEITSWECMMIKYSDR
jgi:hypothetical protein